jgi:hypothetical protein
MPPAGLNLSHELLAFMCCELKSRERVPTKRGITYVTAVTAYKTDAVVGSHLRSWSAKRVSTRSTVLLLSTLKQYRSALPFRGIAQ